MNIKILPSAHDDLINGYRFYEQQSLGFIVPTLCVTAIKLRKITFKNNAF